jgi:hypothetical protein
VCIELARHWGLLPSLLRVDANRAGSFKGHKDFMANKARVLRTLHAACMVPVADFSTAAAVAWTTTSRQGSAGVQTVSRAFRPGSHGLRIATESPTNVTVKFGELDSIAVRYSPSHRFEVSASNGLGAHSNLPAQQYSPCVQ